MMGTGKSTVGKRLANKLNLQFYDSDSTIEEREGLSVLDIYDYRGEEYFRNKEKDVISEIMRYGIVILSTGGDSLKSVEIQQLLQEKAITIWLRSDPAIILERVSRRNTRPTLSKNVSLLEIENLLKEREPHFQQSNIIIDSDGKDAHHVVDSIIAKLKEFLGIKHLRF